MQPRLGTTSLVCITARQFRLRGNNKTWILQPLSLPSPLGNYPNLSLNDTTLRRGLREVGSPDLTMLGLLLSSGRIGGDGRADVFANMAV
jgi:hypothetical protein